MVLITHLTGLFDVSDRRISMWAIILHCLVNPKLVAMWEWQVIRFLGQFMLKLQQCDFKSCRLKLKEWILEEVRNILWLILLIILQNNTRFGTLTRVETTNKFINNILVVWKNADRLITCLYNLYNKQYMLAVACLVITDLLREFWSYVKFTNVCDFIPVAVV
jgi:hypothetical protein